MNVLGGYRGAYRTKGEAENLFYKSTRGTLGMKVLGITQFPKAIATRVNGLGPFPVFMSFLSTSKFQVKSI